jgi:predicted TIM-barrel fold metal-dependent hydrolase
MRWGNYVVTFLMSYATIERMPVQIHTGLATMVETDPRYLIDLMKSFPGVQFDLFHGGYPYFHNVPGILSQINNAFIDLCWMPIISWNATKDLLRECLEWSNQKRIIAFGGDCRSAEGSIGGLISMKNLVSEVLAEFVDANRITLEDAIEIGKDVFYDNPKKLFNN